MNYSKWNAKQQDTHNFPLNSLAIIWRKKKEKKKLQQNNFNWIHSTKHEVPVMNILLNKFMKNQVSTTRNEKKSDVSKIGKTAL